MHFSLNILLVLSLTACGEPGNGIIPMDSRDSLHFVDSINGIKDTIPVGVAADNNVIKQAAVTTIQRSDIVAFAKTLLGTTYKYGCSNPSEGFDCSGFVNYVYSHFNIKVPRSSVEFTNAGKEVSVADAKPGDLILFTGTDSDDRTVGHIGIVIENIDTLKFIHASSGKVYSVVITPLNGYYQTRFIKIVDILPDDL
ncbi:MAG TPA: C40 family peptidase [Ferruginibacter sp.]|jgi:cell wall-associated NlpC family hydrolase|nr:C40 family peptidase [Ferruginibacter sp.]